MQILWLKCDSNPHTLWQVKIYNKTLLAQLDAKGSLHTTVGNKLSIKPQKSIGIRGFFLVEIDQSRESVILSIRASKKLMTYIFGDWKKEESSKEKTYWMCQNK